MSGYGCYSGFLSEIVSSTLEDWILPNCSVDSSVLILTNAELSATTTESSSSAPSTSGMLFYGISSFLMFIVW